MADQATTHAAVTGLLKRYYDKRLIERLEPKVKLYQLGMKRPLPQANGKIIEFTGYRNISPILSNSGELASTQTYISAYTLSGTLIQRHAYLQLSTLLKQTSIDPKVEGAVDCMGDMMARTVELYIRSQVVGAIGCAKRSSINNNNINYLAANNDISGTITGSSAQRTHVFYSPFPILRNKARVSSSGSNVCTQAGSAMTVNEVINGVTFLQTRNVEPFDNGGYVLYCHPMVADRLFRDPSFKTWNSNQNSKETFWKGEIGKIDNTRIVTSTCAFRYEYSAAPLTTSSGAFNASLLLGKDAFGVSELSGANGDSAFSIIVKNPGPNNTNDPANLISTIAGKMVMCSVVLNKSAACILSTTDKVVSSAS
jgi:N4-gp56 family major capsid protein